MCNSGCAYRTRQNASKLQSINEESWGFLRGQGHVRALDGTRAIATEG
eukprot:gene3583-4350_t